jgi:hypothetical protein
VWKSLPDRGNDFVGHGRRAKDEMPDVGEIISRHYGVMDEPDDNG